MENTIYERVRAMLVENLGIVAEEVTVDANLRNDLGLDSLDLFELLTLLEDKLGIEVDEEEARSMYSVQDVITFIERHQSVQRAES